MMGYKYLSPLWPGQCYLHISNLINLILNRSREWQKLRDLRKIYKIGKYIILKYCKKHT